MCDMEEVKVFTSSKLFFIWCFVWSQIFGSQAIASYYQMDLWKQNSIQKHRATNRWDMFSVPMKAPLKHSLHFLFSDSTVLHDAWQSPGDWIYLSNQRSNKNWKVQIFFICTVSMKGDNSSMCIFSLEIRYVVVFWN